MVDVKITQKDLELVNEVKAMIKWLTDLEIEVAKQADKIGGLANQVFLKNGYNDEQIFVLMGNEPGNIIIKEEAK